MRLFGRDIICDVAHFYQQIKIKLKNIEEHLYLSSLSALNLDNIPNFFAKIEK